MPDTILKFGKYKDQDITDVPFDYVVWLRDNTKGLTQQMAASECRRREGLSVTSKLSRAEWGERLAALLDLMPEGLGEQKVQYKGLEIVIRRLG
jgi:hypothetical protein